MGSGIGFIGCNRIFKAPPGEEERVVPLAVHDNGTNITVCWELTQDELKQINEKGRVFVTFWSRGLSPHFVGSEDTVRQFIADNGAFPKSKD